MCNITITPATPPELARAIADGALRAENEALKEAIDMLLCEIAQKDELIELYRWKEKQAFERLMQKYRAPRLSLRQRIAAALSKLMA